MLALQALVFQSQGQITLSDGNSVAHLDPGSQAGMYYWAVLNSPDTYQNQLNKQWFWYRVGTTGPEASIDTLTLLTPSQPTANHVTMTYLDTLGRFNLTIDYLLTGGTPTSGTADIAENIRINTRILIWAEMEAVISYCCRGTDSHFGLINPTRWMAQISSK